MICPKIKCNLDSVTYWQPNHYRSSQSSTLYMMVDPCIPETQKHHLRFLYPSDRPVADLFGLSAAQRWTLWMTVPGYVGRISLPAVWSLGGRSLAHTTCIRCKPPICRCIDVRAIYRPHSADTLYRIWSWLDRDKTCIKSGNLHNWYPKMVSIPFST